MQKHKSVKCFFDFFTREEIVSEIKRRETEEILKFYRLKLHINLNGANFLRYLPIVHLREIVNFIK